MAEMAEDPKCSLKKIVLIRLQVLGLSRADICGPGTGLHLSRLGAWLASGAHSMNVSSLRNLAAQLKLDPAILLYEGDGVPAEVLVLPGQQAISPRPIDGGTEAAAE